MNTQFNSNVIWLELEYKISTLPLATLLNNPITKASKNRIRQFAVSFFWSHEEVMNFRTILFTQNGLKAFQTHTRQGNFGKNVLIV